MRAFTLIALLAGAIHAPLHAADLQFRDGRVWPSVRVLHQEPTYVLVMHEKGIYTVRADEVTEEIASRIGIRLPTPEEVAAREAVESMRREMSDGKTVAVGKQFPGVASGAAASNGRAIARKISLTSGSASLAPPRVVEEFSRIIAPAKSLPIVRLSGRVLARLASGAILQADGMPPNHGYGEVGWVVGTIYIAEDSRLDSTYRGAPLNGQVQPAGEHRYTDSQGSEHVLAAWRLE